MVPPDPVSIGARLRHRRQAIGLTLHDVERRTNGEFKASALGAYERGERTISVPRLFRLAQVLAVGVDEILGSIVEIDLTAMHEAERSEPTDPIERWEEPALAALGRFATYVRSVRRSPAEAPVSVRQADCEFMAMLFGTDPSTMQQKLATFGVHPGVHPGALRVTHDETAGHAGRGEPTP